MKQMKIICFLEKMKGRYRKKKTPQCQRLDHRNPFHIPYQTLEEWPDPVSITSIDIGKDHLSVRVEKRWDTGEYHVVKVDLEALGSKEVLPLPYHTNLNGYLRENRTLFQECSLLIIEKQLPDNYVAVRIQMHIVGWWIDMMMTEKIPGMIMEVSPIMKGEILGSPKVTRGNTPALKRWAVCEAVCECVRQGEDHLFSVLVKPKYQETIRDLVLENDWSGGELFEYLEIAMEIKKENSNRKTTGKKKKSSREYGPVRRTLNDEDYVDFRKPGVKGDDLADSKVQLKAMEDRLNLPPAEVCLSELWEDE